MRSYWTTRVRGSAPSSRSSPDSPSTTTSSSSRRRTPFTRRTAGTWFRTRNIAAVLAQGFEAEVNWDIGHGFSTDLAYTLADSIVRRNPLDPLSVGQQIIDVPRQSASASLTYVAPRGWRVSIQGQVRQPDGLGLARSHQPRLPRGDLGGPAFRGQPVGDLSADPAARRLRPDPEPVRLPLHRHRLLRPLAAGARRSVRAVRRRAVRWLCAMARTSLRADLRSALAERHGRPADRRGGHGDPRRPAARRRECGGAGDAGHGPQRRRLGLFGQPSCRRLVGAGVVVADGPAWRQPADPCARAASAAAAAAGTAASQHEPDALGTDDRARPAAAVGQHGRHAGDGFRSVDDVLRSRPVRAGPRHRVASTSPCCWV